MTTNPLDNSEAFGAAVRRARTTRGLRQEDVAMASGVGLRFIIELEQGKPTAQLDRALRVARAVGLRLEARDD
jgi:y4mF family transcriptional regulator